jgi:hypothetical protein
MFVCVQCNRQMRPKKNGFEFLEMAKMGQGYGSNPVPYRLWSGDLWECQDCGQEIVYTNPRQMPIAEHFQDGFAERCEKVGVSATDYTRA